jgi:Squalene-hopene cyclase C-terminal domain
MSTLSLLLVPVLPAAEPVTAPAPTVDIRKAAEKSLAFLEKSSAAWRADRKCVTCHQVPFTIWALNEAKSHGIKVDTAKLDDLTKWAFDFCVTNEDKGQKTGGFHLTTVDMIFSQSSVSPRDDATKAYPFFESLFAKRQQANGAWKEGNQVKIAGAEKEAEEVDTMWTLLGIRTLERLGDKLPAETRKALSTEREKAAVYLKDAKPGKRIDWLALRMLTARADGDKTREAELLTELRKQQNADGGWGFIRGGTSYPHTTGECLYALSAAGVGGDDPAIKKATKYLVDSQQGNGSWKATSRAAFSTKPDKINDITIHWGTAWATIGLVRTLPVGK